MNLESVMPEFDSKEGMKQWLKGVHLDELISQMSIPAEVHFYQDEEMASLDETACWETRIIQNNGLENSITTYSDGKIRVLPDSSYHHVTMRTEALEDDLAKQADRL